MMPNDGPPQGGRSNVPDGASQGQNISLLARQHALLQLMRQQPMLQNDPSLAGMLESSIGANDNTLLSAGDSGYANQQQLNSLHESQYDPHYGSQHQQRDLLPPTYTSNPQANPNYGASSAHGMPPTAPMWQNPNHLAMNPAQRYSDEELVAMMNRARRNAHMPSMLNTLLNTTSDLGQGNASDAFDRNQQLRTTYNQGLGNAFPSQQPGAAGLQGYGDMASSMASTNLGMGGGSAAYSQYQDPNNHHSQHFGGLYRGHQQIRPNDPPSVATYAGEQIPERIEPTIGGHHLMHQGRMGDVLTNSYAVQQQRLYEMGGLPGGSSGGVDKRLHLAKPSDANSEASPKRKRKRAVRKKPTDMPRRPLSAYNLFFSSERQRILKEIDEAAVQRAGLQQPQQGQSAGQQQSGDTCEALLRPLVPSEGKRRAHRKTHGKISFKELAQLVGQRWKQLTPSEKQHYQDLAQNDLVRHRDAMEAYYKKQADIKLQQVEAKEEEEATVEEKDGTGQGGDVQVEDGGGGSNFEGDAAEEIQESQFADGEKEGEEAEEKGTSEESKASGSDKG